MIVGKPIGINDKLKNNMKKPRGLSTEFMLALKDGFLNSILEVVKRDDTLCLKIKNEYINIYYRGGSILKLENKNGI